MPTKLFLHDASNALSGTFPTAEQSARTTTTGATIPATANTLRTMNQRVGILQTSLAASTAAQTAAQDVFMGYFCSDSLYGPQTVGGGSWTLNVADTNSNIANTNFYINALNIYVWRPSTGALVGTVRDATGLGGLETTANNSIQVTTFTFTTSAISAINRDVIICELWANFTQGMATSYTGTVYFDGTTETLTENTIVTSHASFLLCSETLLFNEKPVTSIGHPFFF